MILNFNSMFILFVLVWGTFLSLSSNNWMAIWLGIEISTMSFIPLMKLNTKLNSESCLKYFIIQSLSSGVMLMGVIMISMSMNFNLIVIFSLLMKLGVVPFHNWVVSIVDGMSYMALLVMFSLLKLPSLNIIFYLNFDLQLLIIVSLWVSTVSALNKNSIKKILCFSSIYNLSICLSCINYYSIWFMYMLFYIMINSFLVYLIFKLNLKFINQIMLNNFNLIIKLSLFILMSSMGGMPPFFMFLGKLIVIENLLLNMDFILSLCIVFSSLLSMFFYIRISILSMMFFSLIMKWILFFNCNMIFFISILMFLLSPVLLVIKSFN